MAAVSQLQLSHVFLLFLLLTMSTLIPQRHHFCSTQTSLTSRPSLLQVKGYSAGKEGEFDMSFLASRQFRTRATEAGLTVIVAKGTLLSRSKGGSSYISCVTAASFPKPWRLGDRACTIFFKTYSSKRPDDDLHDQSGRLQEWKYEDGATD